MTGPTRVEAAATQAGVDDAGTPGLWIILLAVLGPPTWWSVHFLLSYVLVAFACTTGWGAARPALTIVSALALALTVWSGVTARRRWHVARAIDRPTDDSWDARMGERTARVSFLMVVGLALSIVFSIGIVYEVLAVWLVPLCQAGVTR